MKVLCPRCKKNYYTPYGDGDGVYDPQAPPPALSRRDNKTDICSHCGHLEGMEDAQLIPPWTGEIYWRGETIPRQTV